jgi:hypothetical protein
MKDPTAPHPKPFYTPIANEGTLAGSGVEGKLNSKYLLEPVGYGMKFASRFAGTTLLPINFDPGAVNATAYAARQASGKTLVAILNKDAAQPLTLTIPAATVIEVLSGPALDQPETHLTPNNSAVKLTSSTITIPAHTAIMLQLR